MDNKRIISVALLALPTMAVADNSNCASIADTSRVHNINEIIVSSSPKDLSSLRKQSTSSTSLSSTSLNSFVARDMRDVATLTPSFVMPSYGSRYTSSIYVRGIGSRVNSPAVGMYIDDIPIINKSAFNTHLYSVRNIDILRGPQGTLYGQNSEGGLVRVYTKDPRYCQGTDVRLSIGNYLWRMAEISHCDKVDGIGAYSLSAFYNGSEGFQRNTFNNKRADDGNEAGARLKFVRQQTDRLAIDLTCDYQWVRQNGFAYGTYDLNTGKAGNPSTNLPNNYMRHTLVSGLNINYRGKNADVNSTTSYQFINDRMDMDQDYLPASFLSLRQRQLMNAVTEEIAVKSHDTGRWRRVTGAFFSYQWLKTNAPVGFGEDMTAPIGKAIAATIYNSMLKSMTDKGLSEKRAKAIIEKAGGVNMDVSVAVPGEYRTPTLNAALFHESSIQISKRLRATVGLRYDLSRPSIEYDTSASMSMTANIMGAKATNTLLSHLTNKTSDTFNQLLPKIGFTCGLGKPASGGYDTGNVYASASKGYRAGGYNIQMFSDILQSELMSNKTNAMKGDYEIKHGKSDYDNVNNTIKYKPEESWNYEIGTHINLPQASVHLDAALYYMQIKNQQISVMAGNYGFGRMMVNAGRSRSFGGEMAIWGNAVGNNLAWSVAYGYTNATFRSYDDGEANYRGNRVPYVPSHTLSANADYTIVVRNRRMKYITIGACTTAQGDIYWDEANTYRQKFYSLLNARAMFGFSRFKVNIWAKNITCTKYCTFAMDSSASGKKHYFGQKGTPLTFGVDVSASF